MDEEARRHKRAEEGMTVAILLLLGIVAALLWGRVPAPPQQISVVCGDGSPGIGGGGGGALVKRMPDGSI